MKHTEIVSFHEFIGKLSPRIRAKYDEQIMFLQTGLTQVPTYNEKVLEEEIKHPKKEFYDINTFELREALSIMRIDITRTYLKNGRLWSNLMLGADRWISKTNNGQ